MVLSFKTYSPTLGVSRRHTITITITVRGVLESLKSSVITLLCRPDLTKGNIVTELGNVNAKGLIGSSGGRGHMAVLNHQRQGWYGSHNGEMESSIKQQSE